MAESEDRIFSLKGSRGEIGQSPAHAPAARPSAIDNSALNIEAEVENALSAIRDIRFAKSNLEQAVDEQKARNRELVRIVDELTNYKEQAKRELTAAARMLTTEQERVTFLERSVKAAELRAWNLEEWNAKLRCHLDALIASILDESPVGNESSGRAIA